MKLRKTYLAAAVGAALLAGGTAAQAQNVAPGQSGVQVQLYGHVNRAMMYADNEVQNRWFFVDGQPSSTRFGIVGSADIQPGLRGGMRIETEIRSNRSNEVTFSVPSTATQTFTERVMEIFFQGGWGMLQLGQGGAAADGTMEVDFAGVDLALSNPMNDFGGAINFSTSTGAASTITLDSVSANLDPSRYDRVMYTTPTFSGFRLGASYGQRSSTAEALEIGLFYAGKFAGDFGFAIGYMDDNVGAEHSEQIGGSVSWLHTSGLSIGAAYGERSTGGATSAASRDVTHYNMQLGYKTGPHAFGLKYEYTENLAVNGEEATGIGLGWVWTAARWAEIYASYMLWQLDKPGSNFNDITVVAVGSRLRF